MKIVMIGGGSVLWTPRLGCDLLLEPALDGSELYLVDIDPRAVKLTAACLRAAVSRHELHWKIRVADLDTALKKADLVLVSISTGGFDAMMNDYSIPERFGIFHTVGDTVGPGGISRALRNIPVFTGIARKMSRLCPDAWMLHVTNPLTQLTRAVEKTGLVRTAGLCHEYIGMLTMLRDFFKAENPGDIDSLCVGVNHFTVLKNLAVRGVKNPEKRLTVKNYLKYEKQRSGELLTGTLDDIVVKAAVRPGKLIPYYFNFYLNDHWGFFPMASSCHVCENLPGFNVSEERLSSLSIYRKGVLPGRADRKREQTQKLDKLLRDGAPIPEMSGRSKEMFADAAVALLSGEPRRIITAVGNQGQVANLPHLATVETWAQVSRSGIHPVMSGEAPLSVKGFMEQIVAEEELTVEAALTGDFDLFVNALTASPMVADKRIAPRLAEELLKANQSYLPQFTRRRTFS